MRKHPRKFHRQTESTVQQIRFLAMTPGVTQTDLARGFNTTQSNISYIIRRQTWGR